jgi:single-stranded-DNA-specific exonuclease
VTPDFFQALSQMQPFGVGNHEPVFSAGNVKLMAPPQVMKEKHVRMKLAWNKDKADNGRKSAVYKALGWRLAERVQQAHLLPGDVIDIAFTLDYNDHPDFGGLELSLRDFISQPKAAPETVSEPAQSSLTGR